MASKKYKKTVLDVHKLSEFLNQKYADMHFDDMILNNQIVTAQLFMTFALKCSTMWTGRAKYTLSRILKETRETYDNYLPIN